MQSLIHGNEEENQENDGGFASDNSKTNSINSTDPNSKFNSKNRNGGHENKNVGGNDKNNNTMNIKMNNPTMNNNNPNSHHLSVDHYNSVISNYEQTGDESDKGASVLLTSELFWSEDFLNYLTKGMAQRQISAESGLNAGEDSANAGQDPQGSVYII